MITILDLQQNKYRDRLICAGD